MDRNIKSGLHFVLIESQIFVAADFR